MVKTKKIIMRVVLLCLMAMLAMSAVGCDFFKERSLLIHYTPNNEIFVGEEFSDPLLKGTYKVGDKETDVTDEMTVDLSNVNTEVAGTYEVVCSYDDLSYSFEVKVVEETTTLSIINNKLNEAIENSQAQNYLKMTYSYEDSEYADVEYVETFIVNYNAQTKAVEIYTKGETYYQNELVESMEIWLTGESVANDLDMVNSGVINCVESYVYKEEGVIDPASSALNNSTDFLTYYNDWFAGSDSAFVMHPLIVDSLTDTLQFVGTLSKTAQGFNWIGSGVCEGQSAQIQNSLLTNINGVEIEYANVAFTIPVAALS